MQKKQKLLNQLLPLRSRNQNLMLNNNKTGMIKVLKKMKGEAEVEDEVVVVGEEVDAEEVIIVAEVGVVNKIQMMISNQKFTIQVIFMYLKSINIVKNFSN